MSNPATNFTPRDATVRGAPSRPGAAVAALLALALLASCAAARREVAPAAAAPTGIVITDLRHEPAADNPAFVNVTGTVVNDRATPVSGVTVRVQQLDYAGQVLDSVAATLSPETIPPNGGRAQFSARMSSMQLVTYQAVAKVP